MLQEIAKVINLSWNPSNDIINHFLRRIERKMPIKSNPSLYDAKFVKDVTLEIICEVV